MKGIVNGCNPYGQWMSAYHDGELEADGRIKLFRHLSQCPACQGEFNRLERLHDSLKASFGMPVEPDDNLPDLVMAALSREPYRPARRSFSFRLPTLQGLPGFQLGFAATALAGITAFTLGLRPWAPVSTDTVEPSSRVAAAPTAVSPEVERVTPELKTVVKPKVSRKEHSPVSSPAKTSINKTPPPARTETVAQKPVAPMLPSPPAYKTVQVATKPQPSPSQPERAKNAAKSVVASTIRKKETVKKSTRRAPAHAQPSAGEARLASAKRESVRLQQVAGVAETRSEDAIDWTSIPLDTPVRMDQRVRSGDASRVSLALAGGLNLMMNEATEIMPVRAPQADSPFWVVQLVKGEIFARVPKGQCGIKVISAGNMVVAKEGDLIVRSNDLLETRLLVAKGAATLENEFGRSQGTEGMQVSSRMGIAPDPAQPSLDLQTEFQWAYAPIQKDERLLKRPG